MNLPDLPMAAMYHCVWVGSNRHLNPMDRWDPVDREGYKEGALCVLAGGAQQHMQQRCVQGGWSGANRPQLLQRTRLVDHRVLLLRALPVPAQRLPLPLVSATCSAQHVLCMTRHVPALYSTSYCWMPFMLGPFARHG